MIFPIQTINKIMMKPQWLSERANKQPISPSHKLATIYFGESPKTADPFKNMNNIKNSDLLQQKYRKMKNRQFAHKKNKSVEKDSPISINDADDGTRDKQKKPKICQIKYLDKSNQILNQTVCFRGLHKKRSVKGSKDLTEKRSKQTIKQYLNRNTPQFKTKTPTKKQEIKSMLQTIYANIQSGSPRKFFPKILEEEKKYKKNQMRKQQVPAQDQNSKYHSKYLMITNNELIKNPRYVEQLERLKLSIENKRIEDKHRQIAYRRSQGKDIDRSLISYRMPAENKKQLSMTLTQKTSSRPERYSPWHKQKTENQLLGQEYL